MSEELRALKYGAICDCMVMLLIAVCTFSVALFAHSADGLWSMLVLLPYSTPKLKRDEEVTGCNGGEE